MKFKKLIFNIILILFKITFSYAAILLFTAEFNILIWSMTAKIWFLIIAILLIIQD